VLKLHQECIACRLHRGELSAPGGTILRDHLWVLEHIVEPIPIAGWLVLKPVRHVESFAELTPEEALSFGPLTHRVTQAMNEVIRPAKIYLSMYMEGANAAHLHVHLIPRMNDTPADRRGPRIFEYARESSSTGKSRGDVALAAQIASRVRLLLRQD
jgi:diadenosine tetraphosphate (Ap4A) HIT family hydrolase